MEKRGRSRPELDVCDAKSVAPAESALTMASRDLRTLVTSTVRFYVWGVVVSAAVVAITTWLSWGHGEGAQVVIGVGAFVGGAALALLLPAGFYLFRAPYRQRDWARSALVDLVRKSEAEKRELQQALEAAESSKEIRTVAHILGTELRDIRRKIERAKADDPPRYPFGFKLPTGGFTEYRAVLAQDDHVYKIVAGAYTAAHRVNERLDERESRRRPGNRLRSEVLPEDGLDAAHGAAGEALDVLGEPHDEAFSDERESGDV